MTNTLSFELNKTADWRREKAKRHPEDSRNSTAVILLTRMAAQSADADLSDRYEALQNNEDISIEALGDAHSEILREIAFPWEPKHVDEVIERIVKRATGLAPTISDLMELSRIRTDSK